MQQTVQGRTDPVEAVRASWTVTGFSVSEAARLAAAPGGGRQPELSNQCVVLCAFLDCRVLRRIICW